MASIEAVSALLAGDAEWSRYVSKVDGLIDLRYAELAGAQLVGFTLDRCDLTGANLANANFDNAVFTATTIGTDIDLRNASLVGTRMDQTRLPGAHLGGAVVRGAILTDVDLSRSDLQHAVISNCSLRAVRLASCKLSHCRLRSLEAADTQLSAHGDVEDLLIDEVRMSDSVIENLHLRNASITDTTLRNCTVADLRVFRGTVSNLALIHSDVRGLAFENSAVSDLDLSGSSVYDARVAELGLGSAILLDTALVRCEWPDFAGSVSLTGRYTASPLLPRQPIQDVRGVPPIVRRQVADAQFLSRRLDGEKRSTRRTAFRVWGATSAYGQSVLRLSACSLLALLVLALARLGFDRDLLGLGAPDPGLFGNAFKAVSAAFLGFGDVPSASDGYGRAVLDVVARLTGFVVLGLWITIASTHLHRLSGE